MENIKEYLPDVDDQITRNIAEHEIFMSFNSDHHAEAFNDWWHGQGQDDFLCWLIKHQKDYS